MPLLPSLSPLLGRLSLLLSLLLSPALASPRGDGIEPRLDELEERMDQVERRAMLDLVTLGGDYRLILNSVSYEGPSADPYEVDPQTGRAKPIKEDSAEIWSQRLRITLFGEPSETLRFSGRLTMYKHFGDSDAPPFIQDFASTRVPRDTGARFDQAWVDWFVNDWLALSGGRIAYSEGNPAELRENSTRRRATWVQQLVDGEYDSINLTAKIPYLFNDFYLRGFYSSWFFDDDADAFGGFPFLSSGVDNLRIFGGNIEFALPKIGRNFVQLGYYIVPEFRPMTMPISDPGFNKAADYTHAPAPLNGSMLFPSYMPESMGSYQNFSFMAEVYEVLGRFDLFFGATLGLLKPNGEGIAYELPTPTGERQSTPMIFLASYKDEGETYFVFAGGRATLPVAMLNQPKLGFEFNMGSRYHISFATQNDNLLNKIAIRGKAYEGYFIIPMERKWFIRLSYLYMDHDYTGSFFGPNPDMMGSTAPEIDQEVQAMSMVLSAEF
ncbi:DUF3373 domain-containing protein [Myxococcota bacterium]|nr:DUF3373 domain-containing protein [Myxococcota bacterium]MBU1896443.1 DUF3373 domain-containing protein [Myxococcota bacterium]